MEQKKKVLTAVIVLAALVIGVFIGFGMQGSDLLQGKIAFVSEKGGKECEQYKSMLFSETLTSTLGKARANKVIDNCTKKFPAYWNAMPTANECMMLKNRLDFYGVSGFSKFLTNSKVAVSNGLFCAKNYPFMWYDVTVSAGECYAYKYFSDAGGDMTKLFNNNSAKPATIFTTCQKEINWPAAPVFINANTCVQYKQYMSQGILTQMVNQGQADMNIAVACDIQYKLIWQGATKSECLQYQILVKNGTLTPTLGQQKAEDVVYACINAGFDLSYPIK